MRLLWLIGLAALLAGCAIDAVALVHPQTGKEAQCGPYYYFSAMSSGMLSKAAAVEREQVCIEDYQRQGYERMME